MPRKASGKAKVVQEEAIGSVFESLGVPDPDAGRKAKGTGEGENPDMKAMMAQITALGKQVESLQGAQMAMLSVPSVPQVAPQPKEAPKVDLTGLPDQITDPQGYEKALNERISAVISAKLEHLSAAQQAQASRQKQHDDRIAALWDDFGERYSDLAMHPDIIEVAATKVITKARKRGLDVDRYMFGPGSSFLDDVAREMKTRYGKLLAPEGKGADEDAEDEGDDDGEQADARTDGMFGGAAPGAKPAEGKKQAPGDLLDDLKGLQRISGMF